MALAGAGLGFFRGGGGADFQKFQKCFENFVDLYFGSTKLIFSALANYYKDPILTIFFFAPQAIFRKKKQDKTGVFRHFWKIFEHKIAFFGARFPRKNMINWRRIYSH